MTSDPRPLLLAACLALSQAWAETPVPSPLSQLLAVAGAGLDELPPGPARLAASPARARQMPMYRELMARPLQAPYLAGTLARDYREAMTSASELIALTGVLAGAPRPPPGMHSRQRIERALRDADDPLAAGIEWMAPLAPHDSPWPPALPDKVSLPSPLRLELALVLATMGQSHELLQRAFARLPASVTPELLLRLQAAEGRPARPGEPGVRQLLPLVEREALLAGMVELAAAVQRLRDFVTATAKLPAVDWHMDTPLGQIVVDTTGRDNTHRLSAPLLVLDVGGDDRYEFQPRGTARRIAVLLDHGGNDRYIAQTPGADPSAAILGYGILWDTGGDDRYQGTQFAQAAALFGGSLLVDEGGDNEFVASGHAQGYAVGGLALLLGGPGNDRYTAQTLAQGSAGPDGVAVLIDIAGNDRYTLDNEPLIMPSPQLPDRNTSMGQGAGYGIRSDPDEGSSTAGGIGVLLDLAGNDRYTAQVFAQGAGYQEGLGLLVDEGGDDRFEAAWYAMGAAAHRGAGVLLKRGTGHDRYSASHSISIGAAHDFSVAFFLDEGGNDSYHVGDLGLGAAHDNSTALFVDAAGDDAYSVGDAACRAFGVARIGEPGTARAALPNVGLFMDLGGEDAYPVHCGRAGNDAVWPGPRTASERPLRSESGAGIDGEFALPFATQLLVRPRPRLSPR